MLALVLALSCSKPEETDIVDTDVVDSDTDVIPDNTLHGFVVEPSDVLSDGIFRAGLIKVDLATLTLSEEFLGSEVGGELFSMALPLDGPTGLGDPWGTHAGLQAAVYVPVLYEDLDLSGGYTSGDGLIGVNVGRWLAWIGGTVPAGWDEGWTLLSVDPLHPTAEPTAFLPVSEEVSVTMRGTLSEARLWGTMTAPTEATRRMGAFDVRMFTEASYVAPPHVDAVVGADGHFEERIYRRPGTDQFFKESPTKLWYARAVPVAYLDVNGDKKYTDGTDTVTSAAACTVGGDPVWLRYVFQPVDLPQALELESRGWTSGWRAVISDGAGGEEDISFDQSKFVTVSNACAPTWVE